MTDPYPRGSSGRHGTRTPVTAALRPRWSRRVVLLAAAGVVAVLIAAGVAVARGALEPHTFLVRGTAQVVVNSYDGMSIQSAFPDITAGGSVTVVNAAGAVIGTGTLSASDPGSWGAQDAVYAFTVTVPAGQQRYGIEVGRNRGTVWFSERQLRAGPALTISG